MNHEGAKVTHYVLRITFYGILLTALFLRLYQLDSLPPGLTHAEAAHGHDAAAILTGFQPIYFTAAGGREPLFDYFTALVFAGASQSLLMLRLTAVFWGMVAIGATYLWAREAFGGRVALMAAGLMAVSFWPVAVSRLALRAGMLPGLFALAAWAWWRYYYQRPASAANKPFWSKALSWLLFPLLITATLYCYFPARSLWLLFPLFLIVLYFLRRQVPPALIPTLAALAAAGLLALPLFLYLRANPGTEQSAAMVGGPLEHAVDALLMFFWPGRGDHTAAYTLPGKPILDPVTFVALLAGLLICLRRWREHAYVFALIWLVVGLVPVLLTGAESGTLHGVGVMPAIYVLPALAVEALAKRFDTKPQRHEDTKTQSLHAFVPSWLSGKLALALTFLWLSLIAVFTYRDYFLAWGRSPQVRAAYHHTLVSEIDYLDGGQRGGAVVLSSAYPGAAYDPYIAEVTVERSDLQLRWADGRQALIFPNTSGARLIVPASAPLDLVFVEWLGEPVKRVALLPYDLDPYFDVYDWQPLEVYRAALVAAGPTAVQTGVGVQRLPVSFGNAVELEGYQWLTPSVAPGQTAVLLTFWRVADAQAVGPRVLPALRTEATLFVQVFDAAGQVAAEQARLDAPSWDWQTGDRIVQIFRLALPASLPSGEYSVVTGIYNWAEGERLPVLDAEGQPAGDGAELSPLQVTVQ